MKITFYCIAFHVEEIKCIFFSWTHIFQGCLVLTFYKQNYILFLYWANSTQSESERRKTKKINYHHIVDCVKVRRNERSQMKNVQIESDNGEKVRLVHCTAEKANHSLFSFFFFFATESDARWKMLLLAFFHNGCHLPDLIKWRMHRILLKWHRTSVTHI